ncbi:MAG: YgiQ family radical SAM protein [Bradymonadales bacterium]|jgi:uncharacterized radical SAM protein YgiQ
MIFSHKKFWAHRLGPVPVLPMTREEMDLYGWDACDIILVGGDAYVDHPAFSTGIVGRFLEAQGFRVGVIAQPRVDRDDDFLRLGLPRLFWGINAGNMDSMVNHYSSDKRRRSDDAYSPNAKAGLRPDRALSVYSKICRRLAPDIPIVIGGIEASLRRVAHYDYWANRVMPSILCDTGADILSFGNGEAALESISHGLSYGWELSRFLGERGVGMLVDRLPDDMRIREDFGEAAMRGEYDFRRLPAYEEVRNSAWDFAVASRLQLTETRQGGAGLVQRHGDKELCLGKIPEPLSTRELDAVYELPFSRKPHPSYANARIPAFDMIKTSITIMRGCFGACAFCSIAAHEGRVIQSRSPDSVVREVQAIAVAENKDNVVISDLGGPSANMYEMTAKDSEKCLNCRRQSCIYPNICNNLNVSHEPTLKLYERVRKLESVKQVFINSGIRYDLALKHKEYIEALAKHHSSGYLKIAPEHSNPAVLKLMMKPSIETYDEFSRIYIEKSRECGKKQYIIPYFIAAHPGSGDNEMLDLVRWLKSRKLFVDQVQTFLPTPMSPASTMYWTGYNPLKPLSKDSPRIYSAKSTADRQRQKAILRYHDPKNKALVEKLLRRQRRRR